MANAENPLLSLSSEKQQQIVDLVDNGDIADIADKGGMTRRQVLQVAVALGAGATAGGYSVDQIIGEARAAADTSDSDGNVGLPADRVDLFAEGADISGTATANQVGTSSDRFTGYMDTLDANDVTLSNVTKGSTAQYVDALAGTNAGAEIRTQATDGVSTSATTILSGATGITSGLLIIQGEEQNDASLFSDVVHFSPDIISPTVINSGTLSGADSRTYDNSGDGLTLSMAANTYDVVVNGLMTRRDAN